MHIEHVNLTVKNVAASHDFYAQLFGFKLRWQGDTDGEERRLEVHHIGTDNFYLSLFEAEFNDGYDNSYRRVGFNHVAFQVERLELYMQRLEALQKEFQYDDSYEPGRRLYFFDPDGIEVELVEY